ncbi:MAG: hypothetical protein Q9205_000928 [Flavoplaca limonia]
MHTLLEAENDIEHGRNKFVEINRSATGQARNDRFGTAHDSAAGLSPLRASVWNVASYRDDVVLQCRAVHYMAKYAGCGHSTRSILQRYGLRRHVERERLYAREDTREVDRGFNHEVEKCT